MNVIKNVYNIDTKNITNVTMTEYIEGEEPIDGNHRISNLKVLGLSPIAIDEIYVENKWYCWIPLNPKIIKGETVDIIVGTGAVLIGR